MNIYCKGKPIRFVAAFEVNYCTIMYSKLRTFPKMPERCFVTFLLTFIFANPGKDMVQCYVNSLFGCPRRLTRRYRPMRYLQGVGGRRTCLARSCFFFPISIFRSSESDSLTRAPSSQRVYWRGKTSVCLACLQSVFKRSRQSEDIFRASIQSGLAKGLHERKGHFTLAVTPVSRVLP